MPRSVLDVASRARRKARDANRRVHEAVAEHPVGAGLAALGTVVAGTLALRRGWQLYTEYTEPGCALLDAARKLDAQVDIANDQDEFDKLQADWTKAAALYLQAGDCREAQSALGRLCSEGRGYVYDPEFGMQLYEKAAARGDEGAMYALACAQLSDAIKLKGKRESSFRALYHASRRLRRVGGEREVNTVDAFLASGLDLDEFYRAIAHDPSAWIKSAKRFVVAAAATSDDAKVYVQGVYGTQTEPPSASARSYRARLFRVYTMFQVEPNEAMQLAAKLTSDTIGRKKSGKAEAREMYHVALLAFFCLKIKSGETLRQQANELLDAAAHSGDTSAILYKHKILSRKQHRLADTNQMMETYGKSLLDLGSSVGSAAITKLRGDYHASQQTMQTEAEEDWKRAAELGDWDAMEAYRKSKTPFRDSRDVDVVPIPIALALPFVRDAIPVLPGERTEWWSEAAWRHLGLDSSQTRDTVELVTQGSKRAVRVAWPVASAEDTWANVLHALQDTCVNILGTAGRAVRFLAGPIPTTALGKYSLDAPLLTTRAMLRAVAASRVSSLQLCVFDDPTVVAEYDRALHTCARATLLYRSHNQQRVASISWIEDASRFWKNHSRSGKQQRSGENVIYTERMALIVACGDSPGARMLTESGGIDFSKALTEDDYTVNRWLKGESTDESEQARLFKATIAAAREPIVRVHAHMPAITLVFARFDGSPNSAQEALENAQKSLQGAYDAIEVHSRLGFRGIFVSMKSFSELVVESARQAFRAQLEYIATDKLHIRERKG